MSYTVWLKVENDDDADSAPDVAWWSVLTVEGIDRAGAIEAGCTVADALANAGYSPEMLDTDGECDDCGRTDGTHNYEVEH